MEDILFEMKFICLSRVNRIDKAVVKELTSVSPTKEIQDLIAALESLEVQDLLPNFLKYVFPTPDYDKITGESLEQIMGGVNTGPLGNEAGEETFNFSDPLHRESLMEWMRDSVRAGLDN